MSYPARFDEGIEANITPKGHCLITIRWWSQPARRSREWYKDKKASFGNEHDFAREFEIDWTLTAGDAYFPEFKKRGRDFHVWPSPGVMPGRPIYRGWDFGTSRPACVWGQIDDSGRCWIMRELAPAGINIHEFRDLVRYASGQLDYETLVKTKRTRALEIIEQVAHADSGYPPMPWFQTGALHEWVDYGGPEATALSSIVSQSSEQTDAQVLASGGIYLRTNYVFLETREQVMRALLMPRQTDGWPGIIWDPSCRWSIKMMLGGLTRKKDAKGRPIKSEYNKVGLYDDLYDAHSFWLTQEIDPSMIAPDGTIKRGGNGVSSFSTHYENYQ